jgi:hypothetical protein
MQLTPINSIAFGPNLKDAASMYAKNSPVALVSPQRIEHHGIDQERLYDLKKALIRAIDTANFAMAISILDEIIKMHKQAGVTN